MKTKDRLFVALFLFCLVSGQGATRFVDANSSAPTPPFANWGVAAKSIQDAIDISSDGDLILVTNGVYGTGGRATYGALSNRVVLDRVVTVQSVNGPEVTWIVGNSPVGPSAVRCAYLTNGAVLSGFTLTNGATLDAHQEDSAFTIGHVASGGGVWCESRTAIVTNCIITQSTSANAWGAKGGGAYSGSLIDCIVIENRSGEGGGAYNSLVNSCSFRGNHADTYGGGLSSSSTADSLITGNSAYLAGGGIYLGNAIECRILNNSARAEGGGAYNAVVYGGMIASNTAAIGGGICLNTVTRCKVFGNQALVRGGGTDRATVSTSAILNNSAITNGGGVYGGSAAQCTIVGNHAKEGGGISGASATNCVVFFNVAASGFNHTGTAFSYSCTDPLPANGSGNISVDPMFSDRYHLASGSPCIGLGTPEAAPSSDLDGKSWNVTPSMGCDEWVSGSDSGPLTVAIARDSLNANPNAAIEFIALIDGHASSLLWDFGDGSFATNTPLVSHPWSSPGVYQVTLTAFNSDHPSGVTSQVSVAVTSQPTLYVSLGSPNPTPPFLSWATAATNIQDAIDQAFAGGSTVLVSNGLYRTGGRAPTGVLTNRVSLDRPVTVRSLNGPEETIIEGYQLPFYGWSIQADFPGRSLGDSAVRCAYLCDGARLEGFTLTNGATRAGFNSFTTIELSGSGVWCESTNAAVAHCVIVSNICNGWGAGACSGTLVNCQIISNKIFGSFGGGAGIAFSSASDCIIGGNSDQGQGGGALSSTLSNCTVTANARRGAWNCVLINSTISSNDGPGLQGGSATGCVISGNNAGVPSLGGGATSMILSNCFISDNHSSSGGGVYNCVMNDCTLSNNSATVGGGAFWQSAGVVTNIGQNNVFIQNHAVNAGGGLYCSGGILSLTNWTFIGNVATNSGTATSDGGGIYISVGTLSLFNSCLNDNIASRNGGAVYNLATVTADNCAFSNNYANANGGATCSVNLRGCTLTGNQANAGGAAYNGQIGDCSFFNNTAGTYGGGFSGVAFQLLTDCIFSGNQAFAGGGVYLDSGVGLSNCVFVGNVAVSNGGGLLLSSSSKVWNSTFTSNQAYLGGGAFNGTFIDCTLTGNGATSAGGAVYEPTIVTSSSNCVFSANRSSTNGGGVYGGTWSNCRFTGNVAGQNGGGGYNCTIRNSILSGNSALLGGGVYFGDLTQCLLTQNRAQTGGGAYNSASYPIRNCTIAANYATNNAGGVFGGSPTVVSSILYFNSAPTSNNYSGILPSTCCLYPQSAGPSNITSDPAFIDLAGGNYRVQLNSPCIDITSGPFPGPLDLDGRSRIIGSKLDIGAYEFQGPGIGEFTAWLQQNGFPTGGSADHLDSDFDHLDNWQEWIAGTNPTNAASVLAMISATPSPSATVVSWQSVPDRIYYLERASNLAQPAPFSCIQSNIAGLVGTTTFSDLTATNSSQYFYHVGVQ